jgi:hypothetical protein
MASNTHSVRQPTSPSASPSAGGADEVAALAAVVDQLATEDRRMLMGCVAWPTGRAG